jgi:tetratricopeptide (TPR) repeat protein
VAPAAAADGVPIYEATKAQLKSAEQTYRAGDRLYEAGEYEQAIGAFRASHDIVASPNSSLMIARALREIGRLREAHAAFAAALGEADAAAARSPKKYGRTLKAIQKEFDELNGVLGLLKVELVGAPSGTQVAIDGEVIAEASLKNSIIVAPGTLEVTATDPSGKTLAEQVTVSAGGEASVRLQFAEEATAKSQREEPIEIDPFAKDREAPRDVAPQKGSSSLKTWGFVAGGVGVAGLATFGVFGMLSSSRFSDLEESCIDDHCPPDRSSDIDQGQMFQTIANIGLAVGVVGVGTGITLLLLSPSSSENAQATSPRVRIGVGSVDIQGRF